MNFGEKLTHKGSGLVCGDDTDRIIAKFSHEEEAEAFCETANIKAPTDNCIEQLDKVCKRFNDGDINISQLVCTIWNEAIFYA